MLAHARHAPSTASRTDLNVLVDESLNLAYHAARAEDQTFNVTLERDYDSEVGEVNVYGQEMSRVFLNLIGNGFYRQRQDRDTGYRPVLVVRTRSMGDSVRVQIHDNGTGMAEEVRKKVFAPFFTTKPTGFGTGLGLSISYDIVTKQHRGRLEVSSRAGEFTEFTVTLPR